jgi:predicted nucleotidyltransferase
MRISKVSASKATAIIANRYGENAKVWLFGSRARDDERGGDVDIFVESDSTDIMMAMHCKVALADLFDMKVDLIVGDGEKPIHRIAKSTGVRIK